MHLWFARWLNHSCRNKPVFCRIHVWQDGIMLEATVVFEDVDGNELQRIESGPTADKVIGKARGLK